jgi:glycosyltransferase involved in cell wall biosynthesis
MRILVLNWRSIKDPLSGGAEIATFEHVKRWVKNHKSEIVWVSAKYDKKIESEQYEGVKFRYFGIPLNRSNQFQLFYAYPLFWLSFVYNYLFKFEKFDVVIDEVHGLPYFTPLFSSAKIILYIHEVAGVIWKQMYKFPMNTLGPFLEKFIFIPYKNKLVVTGAESTVEELVKLGIPGKNINLIRNCLNLVPVNEVPQKEKITTLVFLNRVVKMKGIELAIDVFKKYSEKNPDAKLLVAGKGDADYIKFLKNKCKELNIENSVEFLGFISEEEKIKILRSSHILINSSYKEGWGMVNIEANSQGTPVVAFKVAGNVDSVKDSVSGYLCESDSTDDMVAKIELILGENYEQLCKSSIEYSKLFDWDINSEKFYDILK